MDSKTRAASGKVTRSRKKAAEQDLPSLPAGLVEAVRNKRVVMFLGAGASMEARDPHGARPPSAADLRDALGRAFFGRKFDNADLMTVADMAIEQVGQGVVFERIRSTLAPFEPSPAHLLLPTFRWRALVTTNYDELVEEAYRKVRGPLQNLVPIVKNAEPVEELLQNTERPVLLLKLHGCINHAHDEQVPMVLSHEHYALHERHRDHLFSRLTQWIHESTFVFCGYGIGDAHIRNILHRLEANGIKRPTYYVVTPTMDEFSSDYWSKKKVQLVKATFGQFMTALSGALPEMWRSLDAGQGLPELSVRKHFRTNRDPSQSLMGALERDLRHVQPSMSADPQDPRRFYEGFDTGWGAILQNLDIRRRVMNDLLLEAFDREDDVGPRFLLLRGPAGSGKTVTLKRAAMEASESFDKLVLWLEQDGALRAEALIELADLTGQRVFVVVDRAAVHLPKIEALLKAAEQKNASVTVVGAERDNEWNVVASRVDKRWKPHEFRMGHLAPREIEDLVEILDRHGSLGLLAALSKQARIEAFMKRADKQLLVALHEATRGKAFEDIVFDEYQGIVPDRAKRLYLDICTLNQFAVPVRAGTISRVAGIRFEDYQEYLFEPLENVVLTDQNRYTGDFEYRTRHSRVAEFVFQRACPTDEAKVEQLLRMIEHLDVGYMPDRTVIESISRGRSLKDVVGSAVFGRDIYAALSRVLPDAPFLYQQWAIYECNSQEGDLDEAERLASRAKELDPRSKSISHTLAEVARRRAARENSPVLKGHYRRLARQRLADAGAATDMLVMSSKCKLLVDDVKDLVRELRETHDPEMEANLSALVRDAEQEIRRAQQLYAGEADLLETEWRLGVILGEDAKALRALERAWKAQPKGAGVAIRLSKSYRDRSDDPRALSILKDALERYEDDKGIHLEMARLLLRSESELSSPIGDHLSRSYTPGDRNFDARHLHAQYLFVTGDVKKAQTLFEEVEVRAPPEFRTKVTEPDSGLRRFLRRSTGRVVTKDSTYCFVRSSIYDKDIYGNESNSDVAIWEGIRAGSQVEFEARFRRGGPVAYDLRPVSG